MQIDFHNELSNHKYSNQIKLKEEKKVTFSYNFYHKIFPIHFQVILSSTYQTYQLILSEPSTNSASHIPYCFLSYAGVLRA